jgi:hypothetical protein
LIGVARHVRTRVDAATDAAELLCWTANAIASPHASPPFAALPLHALHADAGVLDARPALGAPKADEALALEARWHADTAIAHLTDRTKVHAVVDPAVAVVVDAVTALRARRGGGHAREHSCATLLNPLAAHATHASVARPTGARANDVADERDEVREVVVTPAKEIFPGEVERVARGARIVGEQVDVARSARLDAIGIEATLGVVGATGATRATAAITASTTSRVSVLWGAKKEADLTAAIRRLSRQIEVDDCPRRSVTRNQDVQV